MTKYTAAVVSLLVLVLYNVQAFSLISKLKLPSEIPTTEPRQRTVTPSERIKLWPTVQEATRTVNDIKKMDVIRPVAKLILILLRAACQHLKDQGVNPLPDYCYSVAEQLRLDKLNLITSSKPTAQISNLRRKEMMIA